MKQPQSLKECLAVLFGALCVFTQHLLRMRKHTCSQFVCWCFTVANSR